MFWQLQFDILVSGNYVLYSLSLNNLVELNIFKDFSIKHEVFLVTYFIMLYTCYSESLYEDEEFDQRQLAALVVSKVFYYLGELDDSLSYALGAGPLFDPSEGSDYAQTLLGEELTKFIAIFLFSCSKETILT